MTADVEWTAELVLRLVEEYKNKPELWDNHHDLYRAQTAKYAAWSELAASFECDIADLRKKLNSILASHRREKVKVRCGTRSMWFLYDALNFLPHHLPNNACDVFTTNSKQHEKVIEQSSEEEEVLQDVDDLTHEIIIKQESVVEQPTTRKNYKYQISKPRLTRNVKKRIRIQPQNNKIDSKILETLRLLKKSDLSRKKDECDSFGEYIADSLRKHDDRTQSMIKQAINNILFEQEMKKYSSGHYEVVITGVDENPLILGEAEDK